MYFYSQKKNNVFLFFANISKLKKNPPLNVFQI